MVGSVYSQFDCAKLLTVLNGRVPELVTSMSFIINHTVVIDEWQIKELIVLRNWFGVLNQNNTGMRRFFNLSIIIIIIIIIITHFFRLDHRVRVL